MATSPREINAMHEYSDVDSGHTSQHHTLGTRYEQSASGAHRHDGKDSYALLSGVSITGSRSGGAALTSVIAALVKLGAIDASSA